MGYTKPTETTAQDLSLAPLPSYDGDSYTVIRHKFIIDATRSLLKTNGFNILNETYRKNHEANVAQGIYQIQSNKDPELGMMFAWQNSYDKSTKFKCGIGAYVFVCSNGMLSGDMASYSRKHTGSADQEAFTHIGSQIKQANKYFDKLIDDKDKMKTISLNNKKQSELAGRLFIDENLIDASQMSTIKKEMIKPSYDYNCDLENAWTFYNHVTHALKTSHPKTWMSDQKKFHEFMTAELLSHKNLHNFDQSNESIIDPNQTSILDQVSEIEYDESKDIKIHVETDEEYQKRVAKIEGDLEWEDEVFGEFKI
tara:strand:+ start:8531 stop:9463 length:933 start_codon:yes stop_codon:yes gene_type:complete